MKTPFTIGWTRAESGRLSLDGDGQKLTGFNYFTPLSLLPIKDVNSLTLTLGLRAWDHVIDNAIRTHEPTTQDEWEQYVPTKMTTDWESKIRRWL